MRKGIFHIFHECIQASSKKDIPSRDAVTLAFFKGHIRDTCKHIQGRCANVGIAGPIHAF